MPVHAVRFIRPNLLAILAVVLTACGSGDAVDPGASLTVLASAGSNQWAPPGTALSQPIGLVVGRGGVRQAGIGVQFTTTDGSIAPATVITDNQGIATATWTLPSGATPRVVRASAAIAGGPTAQFSAFVVPASNAVVMVTNNVFTPVPQTIGAGQTVTWLWFNDAVGHNVVPLGLEPVGSGTLRDGPSVYSYTFPTSGNYTFYCAAHGTPGGTGMAGVIVVQAP